MSRRRLVRAVIQGPVEARRRSWGRGRTADFDAGAVNRALLTEDGTWIERVPSKHPIVFVGPKAVVTTLFIR